MREVYQFWWAFFHIFHSRASAMPCAMSPTSPNFSSCEKRTMYFNQKTPSPPVVANCPAIRPPELSFKQWIFPWQNKALLCGYSFFHIRIGSYKHFCCSVMHRCKCKFSSWTRYGIGAGRESVHPPLLSPSVLRKWQNFYSIALPEAFCPGQPN